MGKLGDTLVVAFGTLLVIFAIAIASLGLLWHTIKPTVEATELKILKGLNEDTNGTNGYGEQEYQVPSGV